jgi:choline dehydrogenase
LRLALPAGNRLTGQVGLFFFSADTDLEAQLGGNSLRPPNLLTPFPFCVGATNIGGPPPACPRSNVFFLGQARDYTGANREFSGWRIMAHVLRYYLTRKGMMAYTSPEVTALLSMDSPADWPDVQFGIGPFSMRSSEERKADPGRGALEDKPGITVNAISLRPKSRGSISIRSADVADPVEIDANWWGDPADKAFMVKMVRLVRRYMRQPALARFVGDEVVPGAAVETDEQIGEVLEWLTSPGIHATGTCRMGRADDSVVDSRLRVHGVQGLRVVDCSVMPVPPAGNTNGPAMVIGWRAAELILEDRDQSSQAQHGRQR